MVKQDCAEKCSESNKDATKYDNVDYKARHALYSPKKWITPKKFLTGAFPMVLHPSTKFDAVIRPHQKSSWCLMSILHGGCGCYGESVFHPFYANKEDRDLFKFFR